MENQARKKSQRQDLRCPGAGQSGCRGSRRRGSATNAGGIIAAANSDLLPAMGTVRQEKSSLGKAYDSTPGFISDRIHKREDDLSTSSEVDGPVQISASLVTKVLAVVDEW